jgi:asparagine synthase (glutamine-hydrolysing)
MCGIAGIVRCDGKFINKDQLAQMCSIMRHRGPDDEGYSLYDNQKGSVTSYAGDDTNPLLNLKKLTESSGCFSIGFAFRRLSILDLSVAGHQPMISDDQRFMLVFNGEIYNYKELRADLEQIGFTFKSNSDSEVVLASYIAWGSDSVKKFNGMWSICIFDAQKKILFASRDRFGVKPFYYAIVSGEFIFASEIKQIVPFFDGNLTVEDDVVFRYLHDGSKDYSSNTFFKGISQLEPGFSLTYENGKIETDRYWDFEINDTYTDISSENIENEFSRLLISSVEYRYRADVPVGVALSGGLDSSSIAVMVNQLSKSPLKSFTVVYDDSKYDEREYANIVAKSISCTRYECAPTVTGLNEELDEMIHHMEEPIRSISTYSQWCLMRDVKKSGVTVLLEGQGADELLGGYHWYYENLFNDLISSFSIVKLCNEISCYAKNHDQPTVSVAIDAVKNWVKQKIILIVRPKKKFNLLSRGVIKDAQGETSRFKYMLGAQLNYGLRCLIRELLNYGDKTSMKFSVENRVPFLDYRLVEFVTKLPLSQKIYNGKTKVLLRESLKSILPAEIYNRYDKLGFATPQEMWQRNELKEAIWKELMVGGILESKYFETEHAKTYVNDYFAGKHNDYSFVWRCYNFSRWLKIYHIKDT